MCNTTSHFVEGHLVITGKIMVSGRKAIISTTGKAYDQNQHNEDGFYSRDDMFDRSLPPGTLASYRSNLKVHREAGFEVSFQGLISRLAWKKNAVKAGRGRAIKNAILFGMRRNVEFFGLVSNMLWP